MRKKEKIILASGSKSRQKLLKSLGYHFTVVVSNFDEKKINEVNPSVRAAKIAFGKGEAVAKNHQGIIIAGDTFTVCREEVLEKPKNINQAKEMLKKLSGSRAVGYTGFYFFDRKNKIKVSKTAITKVTFRKIYEEEIEKYVKVFPVTTWAAAYAASELYVLGLVKNLCGSLSGWAYGLPTEFLIPLLEEAGYKPKPANT